jgi:hypothetical protein
MSADVVAQIRSALGLPSAPLVTRGIETTVLFFSEVLHADPLQWMDYLRGIDFHSPIQRVMLAPGTRLSRHRSTGSARHKPFLYFTQPGTSPFSTGTSFPDSVFELFECTSPVSALQSRASSISFSPTDRVSRIGGGLQFIVPATAIQVLRQINAPRR